MINETQAKEFALGIEDPAIPDMQKFKMATALDEYFKAEDLKIDKGVKKAFTTDTVEGVEINDDIMAGFGAAPEDIANIKKGAANTAWIARQEKKPVDYFSLTLPAYQDAYAQQVFKLPKKNVTNDEFYNLVRENYKAQDNAHNFAFGAAARDLTADSAMREFDVGLTGSPVAGRIDDYHQSIQDLHMEYTQKLAPYRTIIDQAAKTIETDIYQESADISSEALLKVAESLLPLPAKERLMVINAIGEIGGAEPKRQMAYLQKMAVAMDREIEKATTGTANMFESMAYSGVEAGLSAMNLPGLAKATSGLATKRRDLQVLAGQVKMMAQNKINPVEGENWWEDTGIGIARMAPLLVATMANSPAAIVIMTGQFKDEATIEAVNAGASLENAEKVGLIAAPMMAGLEFISNALPLGKIKIPFIDKWLRAPTTSIKSAAIRLATRGTIGTGTEIGEEILQTATPLQVQDMLSDWQSEWSIESGISKADWDERMPKISDIAKETFGPALIISFLMAGKISIADVKNSRALMTSQDYMVRSGISPDLANQITVEGLSGNYNEVDALFRQGVDKANKATPEQIEEANRRINIKESATLEWHNKIRQDYGIGPVTNLGNGKYQFTTPILRDGKNEIIDPGVSAQFNSLSEANEAWMLYAKNRGFTLRKMEQEFITSMVANLEPNQSLDISLMDYVMPVEQFTQLFPSAAAQVEERIKLTDQIEGAVEDVAFDNATLESEAKDNKNYLIYGTNSIEQREGISTGVITIYKGGGILDVIEESAEVGVKRMMNDPMSRTKLILQIRDVEAKMKEQAMQMGQKHMPLIATADDDQVSNMEIIEAFSHIAKSYYVQTAKAVERPTFDSDMPLNLYLGSLQSSIAGMELKDAIDLVGEKTLNILYRASQIKAVYDANGMNQDFIDALEKSVGLNVSNRNADAVVDTATDIAADAGVSMSMTPAGEIVNGDFFSDPDTFYRVVHGDAAFNDIVQSGLVRTNAGSKGGTTLAERMALRPTAFPSFRKGSAAMSYAAENPSHYIITTTDSSMQPSTSGRHSKGSTMFPTDAEGNHLRSLDGSKVDVWKHLGDDQYQRVYSKGSLVSVDAETQNVEGQTFSISPSLLSVQAPEGVTVNTTDALPSWTIPKAKGDSPKVLNSAKARSEFYGKLDKAIEWLKADPAKIVSSEGWVTFMKMAGISGEIPLPPSGLADIINNPAEYVKKLNGGYHGAAALTDTQTSAKQGMDGTVETRNLIGEGKAPAPFVVALHNMWGILSRMLSPIDQEGMWLRLIAHRPVLDAIQSSINGNFTLTVDQWKQVVQDARAVTEIKSEKVGNAATSNANDFYLMLSRLNGRWNEMADVYSAPNSREMGRRFWDIGAGKLGIKNKVQRFIGLTFGIPGVIMDRWKFVEFWLPDAMEGTSAKKPSDYFKYSQNTPSDPVGIYGVYGGIDGGNETLSLAMYEAFETVLEESIKKSPELQKHLGIHSNAGGMHWFGWNAIKNEAVGHSSLDLTKDLIKTFGDKVNADQVYETITNGTYYTEGSPAAGVNVKFILEQGGVRVERTGVAGGSKPRLSGGKPRGEGGGATEGGAGIAGESVTFSISPVTPAQDAEYLELAKNPEKNRTLLQKMVDAMAKAAGYNAQPVWHGSNSPFNIFDKKKAKEGRFGKGFYFTPDKESAKNYGNESVRVRGGELTLRQFYLKDDTFNYKDAIRVAFDPSQIKSADPVTYDANGNVIPLSQRFNEATPDINFSMSRAQPADTSNITEMPDGAQLVGPTTFSIEAYHGTPHKVLKFLMDKIGTGEGKQAFGWGLYFAKARKVAEQYRKGLTERDFVRKVREVFSEFDTSQDAIDALNELDLSDGQRKLVNVLKAEEWWGFDYPHQAVQAALREPENYDPSPEVLDALASFGNLYTVELLPDEEDFLDWDKPLNEQSEKVRTALEQAVITGRNGNEVYINAGAIRGFGNQTLGGKEASAKLAALGIPGIRYFDGGSRRAGEGTHNYVIFDENLVKILEENGQKVEDSGPTFSISPPYKDRSGEDAGSPLTDTEIREGIEDEQGTQVESPIEITELDEVLDDPSLPDIPWGDSMTSFSMAPGLSPWKQITREDLKKAGKKAFAFYADRMRVGTYSGIDPTSGINIPLQGGFDFPAQNEMIKNDIAWAVSDEKTVKSMITSAIRTGGYAIIALFSRGNVTGNATFLRAYFEELRWNIKQGKITEQQALDFFHEAKQSAGVKNNAIPSAKDTINKATGEKIPPTPERLKEVEEKREAFAKTRWTSLDEVERVLASLSFKLRGSGFFKTTLNENAKRGVHVAAGIMGKQELVNAGMPDVAKMVELMEEPNFTNLPLGTIVGIVQIDPNQKVQTAVQMGVTPHISYPYVVRGKRVGVFKKEHHIEDFIPLKPKSSRIMEGEAMAATISFSMEKANRKNSLRVLLTKKALTDAALTQASWKDWYSEHKETLDEFFGDSAELFQKILSVTSQASSVKANVGLALKAFGQLMRNENFDGKLRGEAKSEYLPAVISNLNAIKNNMAAKGRKISNYTSANEGDQSRVVVDRHIARLLFGVDTPNKAQYDKAEKLLTNIANEIGWSPSQVQAALWAHSIVQSGKTPESYGAYLKKLESKPLTRKELKDGLIGNQLTKRIGNITSGGNGLPSIGTGRGRYSATSPTFSISRSDFTGRIEQSLRPIFEGSPEAKLKIGMMALKRAQKIAADSLYDVGRPGAAKRKLAEMEASRIKKLAKVTDKTPDWVKKSLEKETTPEQAKAALMKDKLNGWIQMHDAIISSMPTEIRGTIGSISTLAKLSSDEARLRFIEDRMPKVEKAIEKYLKKGYGEQIEKMLEAAAVKGKAGEIPKSKFIVTVQDELNTIIAMSNLSDDETVKEAARYEAEIISAQTSEDAADAFAKSQLLEIFGDLYGKQTTAEEMDVAHEYLKDLMKQGRDARKVLDEARAAEVAAMVKQAKADAFAGDANAATVQRGKDKGKGTTKGMIKGFLREHGSHRFVLSSVFGRSNKTADQFDERMILGVNAFETRQAARKKSLRDFMRSLYGTKSKISLDIELEKMETKVERSRVTKMEGEVREKDTKTVEEVERIIKSPSTFGYSAEEAQMWEDEMDAWSNLPTSRKRNLTIERIKVKGTRIEIPLSQMEAVYMAMALRQPGILDQQTVHGYDNITQAELEDFMSDKAKNWLSWFGAEYANEYDAANEVFMRLFNTRMPQIQFYAPLLKNHQGNQASLDPLNSNVVSQSANPGAVKTRRGRTSSLRIESALAVYQSHFAQMDYWINMAEYLRDTQAVMLNPEVRAAIQSEHGDEAMQAVSAWVQLEMARGVSKGALLIHSSRMMRNVKSGIALKALAFNIGTSIKTLSSVFYSLGEISITRWPAAFARGIQHWSRMWDTNIIQNRLELGGTPEIREILANRGKSKNIILRLVENALLYGSMPTQYADAVLTSYSAAMVYGDRLAQAENANVGDEAAHKYAAREMEIAVPRTAQPNNWSGRSLMQNDATGVFNLLSMFSSDPQQKLSLVGEAIMKWRRGGSTNEEVVRKVLAYWVIPGLMFQVANAVTRSMFKDDDEEWEVDNFIRAALVGPLQGLFILGAAAEFFIASAVAYAAEKITGEEQDKPRNWRSSANPLVDISEQFWKSIEKLPEKMEDEDYLGGAWEIMKAGGALATPFSPAGAAPGVADRVFKDTTTLFYGDEED